MSIAGLPSRDERPLTQKWQEKSRVDVRLEKDAADEAAWRAVCKAVDTRDRRICRCCGKRSDPEATGLTVRGHRHHIVYRSAGGLDESSNLVTLCAKCHNDEHKDRLRFAVDGGPYVGIDANAGLEFWRKDETGAWFMARRETAVGTWERD